MSASRVVVIMPVYNEARHLPCVLESIEAQTFDRNRIWFVVVDGNSDDGSRDVLQAWLHKTKMLGRVATNPLRRIPISLNIGLRDARDGDIVLRLDAHSIYGSTYISDAVSALEKAAPQVGCVGGRHMPLNAKTFGERVVKALYTNPMGLGGAAFRFGRDVREVDTVYLGVWRASVLREVGGFNEGLEANEDAELAARLREAGYRILRVPLSCRFIINRGPFATIRQWHRYGYWRARMLQSHPRFVRPRHVISPVSAILVILLLVSPLRMALLAVFAAYAALVVHFRAREEETAVTLVTLFYFPVLQFAFSAGLLRGLLSIRGRRT